jgi:hypothetical protein
MINKMKKILRQFLALTAVCLLSTHTFAGEGESIVLDPATGNYVITHYRDSEDTFEKLIFIPATKIKPTIKNEFKSDQDGIIHYGYKLTSGRNSQQVIRRILFNPVSSVTSPLPNIPLNAPAGQVASDMMDVASHFDTPVPWQAVMGYSDSMASFRIGWYYDSNTGGLVPGGKATFGFNSRDLPGIIQADVAGYAPDSATIDGEELPDAPGNDPFWQQYFALSQNDFLRCPAAVPSIVVPNPFNASTLLGSIQTQMHTWIGMQLLDATFSSQLDRYLTAAADAYRHNQTKVVKEDIEKVREMLKREYQNLGRDEEYEYDRSHEKNYDKKAKMIDRLAAQVLDFDLQYVLKRMNKDHDSE